MKLGSLVKIVALLAVFAVVTITGTIAYHAMVRPLNNILTAWLPIPGSSAEHESIDSMVNMLEASEMPDIDPGERAFQKAHELLALGKISEARSKLLSIIHIYPSSSAAPTTRQIIGSMNLDEILSPADLEGKSLHTVKRGESWASLTARYQTNVECIMWLNSMMEQRNLLVDDELVFMPLNFRLLVEPRRKTVSLWQQGRFICEYQTLEITSLHLPAQQTQIQSKSAEIDGHSVKPGQSEFHASTKSLRIAKLPLSIRSWNQTSEKPRNCILLKPADLEEIFILTRPGNEVEIR